MQSLFKISVDATDVPRIPGLRYLQNFVDVAQELALVKAIDAEIWDTTWDRRRQSYGMSYATRSPDVRPIPNWALPLKDCLETAGFSDRPFDQMLVNEYLPGQGIALHKDYHPFDRVVVSLSLLAACVMDFRKGEQRASLLLEPRSLLVLADDARHFWLHGIARRKNDVWQSIRFARARRVSITFRTLKEARR